MSHFDISIGPALPGFGSWDWLGEHLVKHLARRWRVARFREHLPQTPVAIWLKYPPPPRYRALIPPEQRVVYCPVDFFGSVEHIDTESEWLARCDLIVSHTECLVRYLQGYAPTLFCEHPLKYALSPRPAGNPGPLLWVGARSNLRPLIDWANRHTLPEELWVLTNLENPERVPAGSELGFSPHNAVRLESWSGSRQQEWMLQCRAAIDVKGGDFRSRHKPATKMTEYLASGIPAAINPDSNVTRYLIERDFRPCDVDDLGALFSTQYGETVERSAPQWHKRCAPERVGAFWEQQLELLLGRQAA